MAGRRKNTDDTAQLELAPGVPEPADEKAVVGLGHNSDNHSAQMLQSFVRRIETLDAELADLKSDRSEVLKEAKGEGFNLRVIGIVLRRRKRKLAELSEEEAEIEMYEAALGKEV